MSTRRWTAAELKKHLGAKKSKYRNVPTVIDGFRFDSKAEGRHYRKLCALRQSGVVSYFLRQVPFHLPGGVTYRCDFYVVWADGRISVQDVKGAVTAQFRDKKKMVEALYPVEVEVIKA